MVLTGDAKRLPNFFFFFFGDNTIPKDMGYGLCGLATQFTCCVKVYAP